AGNNFRYCRANTVITISSAAGETFCVSLRRSIMWKIAGVLGIGSLLMLFVPVRADEDANLREVVARAIKAQGGLDNLTKYKASVVKEKGKFHGLGQALDFTGQTSIQLPDRIRVEVRFKVGDQGFTFFQVIG